MEFKDEKHSPTYLDLIKKPNPMPEPEVGKIYHSFDNGVFTLSRLVDWKIDKRIDLDNDKVSKDLLHIIQTDITDCYWLFDIKQTIIFHAYAVDENGKYYEGIGTCYFIRTKDGGWFGSGSETGFWCYLDIDGSRFKKLIGGSLK